MTYIRGIQFDQVAILLCLAPLSILFSFFPTSRFMKYFSVSYITLIYSFFTITLIIDINYYHYFENHLNFLALDYLGEGQYTRSLISSVSHFYLYVLFWLFLSGLLYMIIRKLIKRFSSPLPISLPKRLIWMLLVLAVSFVGIRGRLDRAPLDWGNAYFSQNHHLNQMVLNGVYTFFKNFDETSRDPRLSLLPEKERFPFVEQPTALQEIQELLAQPHTKYLDPENNLRRETTPQPFNPKLLRFSPNIVLVIMESWQGLYTGSLGYDKSITPRFDSLAAHGMLFTNFYANGFRTNYGLAAVLCSYPSMPGRSILKRPRLLQSVFIWWGYRL